MIRLSGLWLLLFFPPLSILQLLSFQRWQPRLPGWGSCLLPNSPAILVGEKPELIVDPATTKNLMVNYPHVIQAIQNARVPQYASGDYSNIGNKDANDSQKQIAAILAVQTLTMERLNRNLENGIQAKLLADDEYVRVHKDVDSRYSKLASKANSSL